MKRRVVYGFVILALGFALSCGIAPERSQPGSYAIQSAATRPAISFEDRSGEIVGHAQRLIEKNEREGAVLDQEWYGFRRFGEHQEAIIEAESVLFFGGLEAQVQAHLEGRYLSVTPLEPDQDPGEIRLFTGRRAGGKWDFILIGQNGREVALKTMIRLLYLAKFADAEIRRKLRLRARPFTKSIHVFMSAVSPRIEYLTFFKKYGIRNPDVVVIGFMGDARLTLAKRGFPRPEAFSDESLRALWYPNINGKKVLLISINGNRIFASRSGDLIEAIYDSAPDSRPGVIFLGSAGAIDAPDWVGKIVAPTSVMIGDPFPKIKRQGALVHLVRNQSVDLVTLQSAHASVESVVVETTEWAKQMKSRRIKTVDQELYHMIDAIHSSRRGTETGIYAGVIVTDHIAPDVSETDVTLRSSGGDNRRHGKTAPGIFSKGF